MKPIYRLLFLLFLVPPVAHAQTKVFKAVAEDMEQEFEPIMQDGKPVGYLMFTQLEKASADSFNYRIAIMDENLNDIGAVSFRQEKLNIKAVSFEQDVLCLVYVKSNFVGKQYKNYKALDRDKGNCKTALFAQFLGLDGKIIGTNSISMNVTPEFTLAANSNRRGFGNGHLKHSIQLRNVSGKGFACFYGDDNKNNLVIFKTTGRLAWQRQVHDDASDFIMLTSGPEISLLAKIKDKFNEGGYEVLSYNAVDSASYPKFLVRDRKGNSLKVLSFDNDPNTGKPYVSGLIIDPVHGNKYGYGKALVHGTYCGLFAIELNGHTRKDIQAQFSYWTDGSQSFVDKDGYYQNGGVYANFEHSFRDYTGNTWFAAAGIHRHPRWVAISASILTAPLLLPPLMILSTGTHHYNSSDVLLVKQDHSGKLTLANTVPATKSDKTTAWTSFSTYGPLYYSVANSDTHTDYMVVDDRKAIQIYNINRNKMARTIPHKADNNLVTVFPAKEGYMMVYEFNKKEKTTRLSIEAL
ncbi:MAG TPA: DUF6770 family protein [Puia sp.]|nr:DUF6770 family protein [Puia sp.]